MAVKIPRKLAFGITPWVLVLTSCGPACENTVLSRYPNEQRTKVAVVYTRSCGATTGFAVHISILQEGQALSGKGNTLIYDGNSFSDEVKPVWLGENRILLTVPKGARKFHQSSTIDGVSVDYANK